MGINELDEMTILPLGMRFPSKNCSPLSGKTSCTDPSIEVNETKDSDGCKRMNVGWTRKQTNLQKIQGNTVEVIASETTDRNNTAEKIKDKKDIVVKI